MKWIGIDYGTRRIGLAISDELGMLASPLKVIEEVDRELQLEKVIESVREAQVSQVILGLPKHMDGTEREEVTAVREFAHALEEKGKFLVKLVDERLSTVQASRLMREAGRKAKEQKGRIDAAAAVVLLQAFLDRESSL